MGSTSAFDADRAGSSPVSSAIKVDLWVTTNMISKWVGAFVRKGTE